jgi:PRC-barrel domain protein
MPHFGTLRDYDFGHAIDDIRGATLYGPNDEKLGEIDDVIFDHDTARIHYAVVDTGGWLTSKKFIVPASRIEPYHANKDDFYTDLDKERIKMFPPYDEKKLERHDDWRDYENEYKKHWQDSPVEHRVEDVSHTITPTPQEMPAGGGSNVPSADLEPRRIADRFAPAGGPTGSMRPDDATSTTSAFERTGSAGRFETFQSTLERDRQKIIAKCLTCRSSKDRAA